MQEALLDCAANISIVPMKLPNGEEFEVVGTIEQIERIAVASQIREISRLRKVFGAGRWLKLKGTATVRFEDGAIQRVELRWYEAHGIGCKKLKIKEYLDY